MASNGINSTHLVSPIVRCVSNVRPRDAYDAPPGTAPFHRFLQANRLANRGLDRFELSEIHTPQPASETIENPAMSTPLLPSLGEIIPPEPTPKLVGVEVRLHQQYIPATGHALDIYA
tara:strand:+ start:177838 stop:178191 length:354 start_codon:yes stop_codon:yes gene_type:complete